MLSVLCSYFIGVSVNVQLWVLHPSNLKDIIILSTRKIIANKITYYDLLYYFFNVYVSLVNDIEIDYWN